MDLIDELIREGHLKAPQIIKAFRKIKRENFVLTEDKAGADINVPLPIGSGQTISQPLTVAIMLELLEPQEGDRVLDIGSGSGWTTALLAEIVGENGKIFGIERVKELADFGSANIAKYNYIKKGRVRNNVGDGYLGLPEEAPFDKILVSAATEAPPAELLKQLKISGKMVIPIGKTHLMQDIVIYKKLGENEYEEKRIPGFIFVPLIKNDNE